MKQLLAGVQSGDWYDESNDDASMALAVKCGIEAIDYNIDHVINPAEYRKGVKYPQCDLPVEEFIKCYTGLKEASEKYGVVISQMHAPFPTWFEGDAEATDYLLMVVEKVCAVCQYVGCPAVVVHPYESGEPEKDFAINLEMYRRLMPAARKYGVKICLENTFKVFNGRIIEGSSTNAEYICKLMDTLNGEAGEELFGFCFDVGHANITGKNIRQYLNTLGKRLTLLHIHDNNGKGDMHLIPYTQTSDIWGGNLATDWEGFIAGLRDIGYVGALSFETFNAGRKFPKEVEGEMLALISALGRYFRKRITE